MNGKQVVATLCGWCCWPLGLVFGLLVGGSSALAQECTRKVSALPGSWQEYRVGEFIVQYTVEGEHALQQRAKASSGGQAPAVVGDAALQLEVTRAVFQRLGFQLPLESARYRSQGATHILVRFQHMPGMGIAYDEVARLPSGECVLGIALSSRYQTGNMTPAHEYFHQIQNGYTMFKRPWFYEGTARWAESVVGKRPVASRPVPADADGLAKLWRESYSAVSVWQSLAEQCTDAGERMHLPPQWFEHRYSNGEPVVLDDVLSGHRFMLRVLRVMGELSDRVRQQEGLQLYQWPEVLQREPRYDKSMWIEVLRVCYAQ